jgi:predicted enzyme related to lactoylglutathione lyase
VDAQVTERAQVLANVALEGEHADRGDGHATIVGSNEIRRSSGTKRSCCRLSVESHITERRSFIMVDFRIELIILPVSDVDRARAFYGDTLGWPVDHDQTVSEEIRFVQVTPPGSAASVAFGKGLSEMKPGSLRAIQVVVDSADAALADLKERGVDADGVDDQPWGRFVSFADPDGNTWTVQEMPEWSAQRT